ncbi:MAG TPA: sulfurtransferase [Pseudonocardia sp.]|nr:sulfurtransferase [Pseudonocardia sp.]
MLPLITTQELARALNESGAGSRWLILDVRWRLGGPPADVDYRVGHIPGALFVDLETVLADPPGAGGRHPIPEAEVLAGRFAGLGVSDTTTVVVYDDRDGSVAARAWWLLRWLGLPARQVRVLDGGYAAWIDEDRPVSDAIAGSTVGNFTARPGSMPVLDADASARAASRGTLLDARAPARYLGDTEPVDPRAGHIPGARNAPFAEHVGPDGRWRSPEDLAAHYRGLGVTEVGEVGAYCGSGVTATSIVLAVEYAGLRSPEHPIALYPGSWSQWSSDPARPVSVGPEPESETGANR